jgi:hypothetical protein
MDSMDAKQAELDAIRQAGIRDYAGGRPYRNPHGADQAKFDAYERGWMQGLKREETKPAWKASRGAAAPCPKPAAPPPELPNEYARLKGRVKRG